MASFAVAVVFPRIIIIKKKIIWSLQSGDGNYIQILSDWSQEPRKYKYILNMNTCSIIFFFKDNESNEHISLGIKQADHNSI